MDAVREEDCGLNKLKKPTHLIILIFAQDAAHGRWRFELARWLFKLKDVSFIRFFVQKTK